MLASVVVERRDTLATVVTKKTEKIPRGAEPRKIRFTVGETVGLAPLLNPTTGADERDALRRAVWEFHYALRMIAQADIDESERAAIDVLGAAAAYLTGSEWDNSKHDESTARRLRKCLSELRGGTGRNNALSIASQIEAQAAEAQDEKNGDADYARAARLLYPNSAAERLRWHLAFDFGPAYAEIDADALEKKLRAHVVQDKRSRKSGAIETTGTIAQWIVVHAEQTGKTNTLGIASAKIAARINSARAAEKKKSHSG